MTRPWSQRVFTRESAGSEPKAYLEVLDERSDAGVRLVVALFMGKFLQLRQERDGIPRGKQGQQVRGQKLSHRSPEEKHDADHTTAFSYRNAEKKSPRTRN